jgi:hypothetical protein
MIKAMAVPSKNFNFGCFYKMDDFKFVCRHKIPSDALLSSDGIKKLRLKYPCGLISSQFCCLAVSLAKLSKKPDAEQSQL